MNKAAYTVSQLTQAIKNTLEPHFRGIYVRGEISNLKRHSSGHIYFSLKDKDSQIPCAFFRGNAQKCSRLPKDGDQVTIFGELSIYPPRGYYQILVKEVQFLGVGELLAKLHERKEKLQKLGYFDPKIKKKLPTLPKKIGIITSSTGAVIQDILHVLNRRFSGFHLLLYPVRVQGEGAAKEIAKAIIECNRYAIADVLIVGRGGGSIEDLWAFNEEQIVEAIFASKIPIISAVGHETDYTLADLASDVRAPTPSAAAEIVLKEKNELLSFLDKTKKRIDQALFEKTRILKEKSTFFLNQPLFQSPYPLLGRKFQEIDEKKVSLNRTMHYFFENRKTRFQSYQKQLAALNPIKTIQEKKNTLSIYQTRLNQGMQNCLSKKRNHFEAKDIASHMQHLIENKHKALKDALYKLTSHLSSIDPKNLLKKGYSILFSEKDHSIILSAKNVNKKDSIYAVLPDGKLFAEIKNIELENKS